MRNGPKVGASTYSSSGPTMKRCLISNEVSRCTLHVSRKKDGKWRLVYAGWHDTKVVQTDGCGQARRGWKGETYPPQGER